MLSSERCEMHLCHSCRLRYTSYRRRDFVVYQFSHCFLALVGVSDPAESRLDLRRPPCVPGVAPAAAAAAAAPMLDFFELLEPPAPLAGDTGGFFPFIPVPTLAGVRGRPVATPACSRSTLFIADARFCSRALVKEFLVALGVAMGVPAWMTTPSGVASSVSNPSSLTRSSLGVTGVAACTCGWMPILARAGVSPVELSTKAGEFKTSEFSSGTPAAG